MWLQERENQVGREGEDGGPRVGVGSHGGAFGCRGAVEGSCTQTSEDSGMSSETSFLKNDRDTRTAQVLSISADEGRKNRTNAKQTIRPRKA